MCDEHDPLAGILVVKEGFRDGRPCIAGAGITVHTIVAAYLHGGTPDELAEDFPRAGRPGVYAALAYYFAHPGEIEADWESDEAWGEEMIRQQNLSSARPAGA